MSEWVNVIKADAMTDGEHIVVDVDGSDVAVFKVAGEFYAIEDVCTHDGAEIASGDLMGDEIVCPRHGARFCVRTGEVKCAPAYEDVATFAVQVVEGVVQVKDDRWD